MGALCCKATSRPQIGNKMTLCVATSNLGDSVHLEDLVPSVVCSPYVMFHSHNFLNSGNMHCAIKCSATNDCGAFYYESSTCHLAKSALLRKPMQGSTAFRSVYAEEAKWLCNQTSLNILKYDQNITYNLTSCHYSHYHLL